MGETDYSLLDLFLDGLLGETERRAYEAALRGDAVLQAAARRQVSIDEALRRAYLPPSPEQCVAGIRREGSTPKSDRPRATRRVFTRRVAVAALIAVAAVGMMRIWGVWPGNAPDDPYAPQPWRGFATVYADTLDNGFKPTWVCRDDRQFRRTFEHRLGQPLLLASLPSDIQMGGLAYSNTLSPLTINVLMHVADQPVIVFVDRREKDGSLAPSSEGLHLFRGEVGDLVLYELTPLEEPHVLPFFHVPTD